jgi:hypothetical protein
MKKIVIAFIVLVVVAVLYKESRNGSIGLPFSKVQMTNSLPRSSSLYSQHQAFIDKFNSNEKIINKFGGVISSKGLFAIQKEMYGRGIQSLPREQLVAENKALVAVMVRLPLRSCAKLARPSDDYDPALTNDMLTVLEKMPDKYHKTMTDFLYDAMVADVENMPKIPVNQSYYQAALQDLSYTYHGSSAERINRILANLQAANDEDACWAINSLMTAVEKMPAKNIEAFLRHSSGQ